MGDFLGISFEFLTGFLAGAIFTAWLMGIFYGRDDDEGVSETARLFPDSAFRRDSDDSDRD